MASQAAEQQKGHVQSLVDAMDLAHRALDVQRLDILPVLLQQRHQEVHGDLDVHRLQPAKQKEKTKPAREKNKKKLPAAPR